MTPANAQVQVIIVGSWNRRIFTPEWVKALFGIPPNENLEGLVNFDEMAFAFKYKGIVLMPKANQLELKFETYTEEAALFCSKLIVRILELLPQTPLRALGVNISYLFASKLLTDVPILRKLSAMKCEPLDGFKLYEIRQTKDYSDCKLNLICDYRSPDTMNVNFNFHYSPVTVQGNDFIATRYTESQKILLDGK